MALLSRLALSLACLAALGGCVGKAVNQAQVYAPVSGVVQMEVKVPQGESFAKVQFQVNGEEISVDEDATDGYTAEIDTANLPGETLVKIAAVGVRPDGTTMVLRENFVLIAKHEEAAAEGDAAAAGDGSADAPAN